MGTDKVKKTLYRSHVNGFFIRDIGAIRGSILREAQRNATFETRIEHGRIGIEREIVKAFFLLNSTFSHPKFRSKPTFIPVTFSSWSRGIIF
jgi:hypothetical protein